MTTRISLVLIAVGTWVLVSSSGLFGRRQLPGPATLLSTAHRLVTDGQLGAGVAQTLERALIGIFAGAIIGSVLGFATGLWHLRHGVSRGPVSVLAVLPVFALMPVLVAWFGAGGGAKLSMVALAAMLPVYLSVDAGVARSDPALLQSARAHGLSRPSTVRRVVLPGAMPDFWRGLRYCTAAGWVAVVVSEQVSSTNGLGALMTRAEAVRDVSVMAVCLIVYAFFGLASDALVRLGAKRALAWR